ncbi:MrcB family domain-containing protein [Oceanisphaera arctica]|uniref:MrcB family domain-containing protein n=1 Tax=Oceanisphaera arctica TaxID=641510 RepID=UPI001CA4DCF3|nr:DUF3578 domain-containing protein [Oceanisphaera arctica]
MKEILETVTNSWSSAIHEQFTDHPVANLLRQELLREVKKEVSLFDPSYEVKSSAGAGNWASVPWLSILNPRITTSTQSGVYPVYLFCADGSGLYLSLGFGTTELKEKYGTQGARKESAQLREEIRKSVTKLDSWNETINLNSNTSLGKSYEWASAGAKFYPANSIPDDNILLSDLNEILSIYSSLEGVKMNENTNNDKEVSLQSLSKPLLLLAGISGTGKSRFIRKQAEKTGSLNETYCLVSVRPDWHEPSDLLGYISRLNGAAEYVITDVLQFITKAWRAIVDAGISVERKYIDNQGEAFAASGEHEQLHSVLPYWLCLDEMNLAPVEQYFADYLSVLETRQWSWNKSEFCYLSDPLLKATTINQLSEPDKLREELGLADEKYDVLWQLFCKHGIGIPFNLIVAGTVNMDETTHGFSRKVIDRALSFDFGDFFPNDFSEYFNPTTTNKALTYPIWSFVNIEQLPDIDIDGKKSIAFLNSVNEVLDNTPFKLAFRSLNELLLSVISQQPQSDTELKAIWDDFLMCKVLPRIEGDSDKLAHNDIEKSLLMELHSTLENELSDIWHEPENSDSARPDLYREKNDGSVITIPCRSKKKITWMQNRLSKSGFTSFWP